MRTRIRRKARKLIVGPLPKVAHGSGTTDYNRVRRFGVPAKRESEVLSKIDLFEKWDTDAMAHKADRARQKREKGLINWERVSWLLEADPYKPLEQAKMEAQYEQ